MEPPTPLDMTMGLVCRGVKCNNLCSQIRPTTELADNGMLRCNYHKSYYLCVQPATPLTSTSLKNPHFVFLLPFPLNSAIVSLHFCISVGSEGALNFNRFDETEFEWMRMHVSACMLVMCNEEHAFPFILQMATWGTADGGRVETHGPV